MKAEDLHKVHPGTLRDIVIHEQCSCGTGCPAVAGISAQRMRSRIVRHCSPTLAGLKCGSMFKMCGLDPDDIENVLSEELSRHHDRGLMYEVLNRDGCGTLIYIYRPRLLSDRLSESGVWDLLSDLGYTDRSVDGLIRRLKGRFDEPGMPPEVGIFLDYPLEDVLGYMQNGGRDCRVIGCWKVYGDVDAAERRFRSYRHCRDVFMRRLSEGSDLGRLVVRCRSEPGVQ